MDGKLGVKSQVVLNQLSFGDKVDPPTATELPVLLAGELLKDGNGVIDINLPVTDDTNGSTFSVDAIIWKVIPGPLTKTCTSPFSRRV